MFAKQLVEMKHSNVFQKGEELGIVKEITLDSSLTFKSHVKKLSNIVQFNLKNCRPSLTVGASRLMVVGINCYWNKYGKEILFVLVS